MDVDTQTSAPPMAIPLVCNCYVLFYPWLIFHILIQVISCCSVQNYCYYLTMYLCNYYLTVVHFCIALPVCNAIQFPEAKFADLLIFNFVVVVAAVPPNS